jgi:hypothetical protein
MATEQTITRRAAFGLAAALPSDRQGARPRASKAPPRPIACSRRWSVCRCSDQSRTTMAAIRAVRYLRRNREYHCHSSDVRLLAPPGLLEEATCISPCGPVTSLGPRYLFRLDHSVPPRTRTRPTRALLKFLDHGSDAADRWPAEGQDGPYYDLAQRVVGQEGRDARRGHEAGVPGDPDKALSPWCKRT